MVENRHAQRTGIEIAPRDLSVRSRVAAIYQRLGSLKIALAHWLEILKIDPNHAEALSRVESLRGLGVEAGDPI